MEKRLIQLYNIFGVSHYTQNLIQKKQLEKLDQLNRILAKYILSRVLDDLPNDQLKKLDALEVHSGNELLTFLQKHVMNFFEKIKFYGKDFQREFAPTGLIG
ncbi:hypothetical protein HYS11_00880 [Candidatus Gottesmanbacteria bacterium]|nr:hypothetical protein [Candidatus Gottesmanbacteria bacterium]